MIDMYFFSFCMVFIENNCDLFFSLQYVSASGYFELQILKVKNIAGERMDGKCCDGERGP